MKSQREQRITSFFKCVFLTLVFLYTPIDRGMTSSAAKRSSCDNCCARRKKTFVRVREDMKINEIFFLVFPVVLQTANAAIMQCDICRAINGVADCRKFYRSCIRIVSSEPPREIFVPKCGQQIIPLGMKMLISHNGKRCYGKFFLFKRNRLQNLLVPYIYVNNLGPYIVFKKWHLTYGSKIKLLNILGIFIYFINILTLLITYMRTFFQLIVKS